MAWCMECAKKNRIIKANKELDGDPLCDPCYTIALHGPNPPRPSSNDFEPPMRSKEMATLTPADRATRTQCPGGCGKLLRSDNKTGICKPCEKAQAKTGEARGKSDDVKVVRRGRKPGPQRKSQPDKSEAPESVTVELRASVLDRIWSGLTLQEKAEALFPPMELV